MSESPSASLSRSYRQHCGVARGLDLVGERWTLLIVRDLLTGPKRYTDLLVGLPGIGTNLLAARLRELEQHGIVSRRVLPPPAASTVYELTETGQGLEQVVVALGRWGHHFLGPRQSDEFLSASAYLLAMRSTSRPAPPPETQASYELRVGDQVFEASVAVGQRITREGRPRSADAILTMDVATLAGLLEGDLAPGAAYRSGAVTVDGGEVAAVERFVELFGLRPVRRSP